MGEVQEVQLQIRGTPKDAMMPDQLPLSTEFKRWHWWLRVALYSFFIIGGQTVGTLLGRFYYDQGGNSKWMATIVSSAGFPIPLILLLFSSSSATTPAPSTSPTLKKLAPVYIALGLIISADNLMYSYGLLYLPVSTYALVCATQLAFNAVFSYFFNSQKFTCLIFNSVVLLTFAAALLGVDPDSKDSTDVSKGKYPLGFILTLGASATFSLILSLTQLTFQKILKRETFFIVMELVVCTSFIATIASVVGLFASGEWRELKGEMQEFKKGRVSYVMTLVWTAIIWQLTGIGFTGLAFVVSSLFSNMIGTFGLPLLPIFGVVLFHDSMDGVKVVAMLISIWGFLTYFYQDYVDYLGDKKAEKSDGLCSELN